MGSFVNRAKVIDSMIYWSNSFHSILVLLCIGSTSVALIKFLNYYQFTPVYSFTLSTNNQSLDNSKRLCMKGILRRMKSDKSLTGSSLFDLLTDGEDPQQNHRNCRLHHYKFEDVVTCLNRLDRDRINQTHLLHFAFVGDSTIREQYDNFRQLIPDYDMKEDKRPSWDGHPLHMDASFSSQLLNLRVSFFWRHLADELLIDTFRNWITPYNSAPDFIFMAVILHHMVPKNGNHFKFLEKGLTILKPMFRKLIANNKTRIVWKIQAPGPWGAHESDAKVPHYNQRVQTILKDSGLEIWDSSDPLGMERSRGCNILHRHSNRIRCKKDPVHQGNLLLEHSTQIIFNDICNRLY